LKKTETFDDEPFQTFEYYPDTFLLKSLTYYNEPGTDEQYVDEYGNIFYEWENNDFYGNGECGRQTKFQRFQDLHMIKTLSWFDGTDDVKKEEEFTDLSETGWVETRWYRDNGRLKKKVASSGEACVYHDADGFPIETFWNSDGTAFHYATIEDYNNSQKTWYMNGVEL
jgi:hypothetical protein